MSIPGWFPFALGIAIMVFSVIVEFVKIARPVLRGALPVEEQDPTEDN